MKNSPSTQDRKAQLAEENELLRQTFSVQIEEMKPTIELCEQGFNAAQSVAGMWKTVSSVAKPVQKATGPIGRLISGCKLGWRVWSAIKK